MTATTEAAVLTAIGRPLELTTLELPGLAEGQVLVEIAFAGVCHSQLNEVKGLRGPDRFLPHCLGHEGAGVVAAVGPGVTKVVPGQRVVLTWIRGEGGGPPGVAYRGPSGPVNAGAVATFMRKAVVAESRVVPLPEAMPLREAALLGCAVATGVGAVVNVMKPKPGQSLVVFGAGGIGLSAVMGARAAGVRSVVAVDRLPEKLAVAKRLGATATIDAGAADPVAAVRELTEGRGADFAFEASGTIAAMQAAWASTRDGGLCVLAGNPPVGQMLSVDPYDLIRGKRLIGTWGGETDPDTDIPRYARMFLDGVLPLGELVTGTYPLTEVNAALDDLERGRVARALLAM